MLECKDIRITAGSKDLFSCHELALDAGLYALVGRNGSGKSTFLNALLGESAPVQGAIRLDGEEVSAYKLEELSKKISIVRAKPLLYGDYTVREILLLGRLPYQNLLARATKEDAFIVEKIATEFNLTEFLDQEYNLLSDGEKQLCMVARAYVQDTAVILLDEPSAFLDLVNKQGLLKKLKNLADSTKKLILFSTHHVEILSQYCEGVLLINQGELRLLEDKSRFQDEIENAFGLNE